jgi:hypothetical protein
MPGGLDEGSGATVTFSGTGVTLLATSIQGQGVSWAAMDTTTLATTGGKTFKRGDTYDPGTITISCLWDPSLADGLINSNASETITITYPPGANTSGKEASSGFIQSFDSGSCEVDSIMTGQVVVKRSGTITFTDASA